MTDLNYNLIRKILESCSTDDIFIEEDTATIKFHYKLLVDKEFIKEGLAVGAHTLSDNDEIIYRISDSELTTKGYEFLNSLKHKIADAEISILKNQGKSYSLEYVFKHLKDKIFEN